ncbi:MAG TPA: TauD/TfdA family dioxygenase [Blastocatellia bacterium]|nr:TauD/TfdA family dioxygenase [Blastocatellia bacterium]
MTNDDQFLPPEIQGPSAWYGPQFLRQADWIYHLSESEIIEIGAAADALASASRNFADISPGDFPVPTFGPRLQGLLGEVLDGRGFVLMRRLPVERWGNRKSAIAFMGIGRHLGSLRPQNADGHLLGHVKDMGRSSSDPDVRIYQTRERQTFHTDSCDVVGLLCLSTARSGGLSSLVSSTTIFNEMRRRRPDLARVLFEPIETDRRGEVAEGEKPYFKIPVFNWHAGLLSTIYQRQYIESARRFADVQPLTQVQIQALDLLDELANDPRLHLMMKLERGDVQFVHNHTVLHDRTAYEDWPEPDRKRHLLRLWLAPPGARPLPEVFAERYGSVAPGDRGGVAAGSIATTVMFGTDELD